MNDTSDIFVASVRAHWRRLHIAARRYAATEHDAHDLVQETLLRAWRSFSPTGERGITRAWLLVIMRNVAAEWHRTAGRRISLVPVPISELTELATADPSEPFAPLPSMDEGQFRELLDDRLAAALDALEEPFREVVLLSVAGELTYREIAEVLDCPVGTVMSRMARARRALRERLSEYAGALGHSLERRK